MGSLVAGAIWQYKKKRGAYAPREKKLQTEKAIMNRLDSEAAASRFASSNEAIISARASPIEVTSL